MTFEDIMELSPANESNYNALKAAIKGNTVVPFTGAGMSAPYYPMWGSALEYLQSRVAPDQKDACNAEMASAKNEIERCDVLEKYLDDDDLCRALCALFDLSRFTQNKKCAVQNQAVALLPRLFPQSPLLTTNLERMAEEVFRLSGVPFDDKLTPNDVDRLAVLQQQNAHGILYLHGCVSGKLTPYADLVFSKAQYERHYADDSPLVTQLQEWMEKRQLLFLGCSLRNDRTLEILGKVCAANRRLEHFAILDLKEEDACLTDRMNQLYNDYRIRAILYPNGCHEAVRIILKRLADELGMPLPGVAIKRSPAMRYAPAAHFRGRDALVKSVVGDMMNPESSILLVYGFAGIGKTEICKAAYRDMKARDPQFDMPCVDLLGADSASYFYSRLARSLGMRLPDMPPETIPDYLPEAIADRLEGAKRWVWLDNFEELWQHLEVEAQNGLMGCLTWLTRAGLRLLIASQVALAHRDVKPIPVGPLDEGLDRAGLFVDTLGRAIRPREQAAFDALLNETGGHPLSIVLTASYGRTCGNLSKLLDKWHAIDLPISPETDQEAHKSLRRALTLAWTSVEGMPAAVRRWALHALSQFPLDDDTLEELREQLPVTFDNTEWLEGERRLRELGLVDADDKDAERMLPPVKKVFASLSEDQTAMEEALHAWTAWGGALLAQGDDDKHPDYQALHDRALKWLPQCLSLAEACLEWAAYDDLIRLLYPAHNFYHYDAVRSTDLLERLLRAVPKDFPLRSAFYERLGYLLPRTGKPEDALAAFAEAETLYKAEQDNWGLANVLHDRGYLLRNTGKPEDALAAYAEAEKLYHAVGAKLGLANVLESRGVLLSDTGKPEEALAAWAEAEKLYEAEGVKLGLANVLWNRGNLLRDTGKPEDALAAYAEAEKLYQAEGDKLGLANVLFHRGNLLRDTGKPQDALAACAEAEKLYHAVGAKLGLANVQRFRGNILQDEEDWAGACARYEEALALYRQVQTPRDICYTLSELQLCEKRMGKLAEAEAHIRELMELLPGQPENVQRYANWKLREGGAKKGNRFVQWLSGLFKRLFRRGDPDARR